MQMADSLETSPSRTTKKKKTDTDIYDFTTLLRLLTADLYGSIVTWPTALLSEMHYLYLEFASTAALSSTESSWVSRDAFCIAIIYLLSLLFSPRHCSALPTTTFRLLLHFFCPASRQLTLPTPRHATPPRADISSKVELFIRPSVYIAMRWRKMYRGLLWLITHFHRALPESSQRRGRDRVRAWGSALIFPWESAAIIFVTLPRGNFQTIENVDRNIVWAITD